MTNLLDPKQDYIFKNIFGTEESKPQLISFLNALLFNEEPHITSITLDNPNIEKILEKDKASRLDIRATTNDGIMLDIEIQCKNTGEIPQRAFHYLANMMSHAIKSNESYKESNVIGIWILGENVTNRSNAISEAYMTFQPNDPDPYQVMTDNARIIFIELLKFNPKNANTHNLLTAWLSFLKDPILMDEMFLRVPVIHDAMETLKYISSDDEIRAISDLRQRTINDKNSELTVAREEGLAEGMEMGLAEGMERGKIEGKIEGIKEEKIEMAKKMLTDSFPIETISKYTGLTESEINSLVN